MAKLEVVVDHHNRSTSLFCKNAPAIYSSTRYTSRIEIKVVNLLD